MPQLSPLWVVTGPSGFVKMYRQRQQAQRGKGWSEQRTEDG